MHVACVLIDHFPFKLEAVRDPLLKRRRVIVFKRSGSQRTVVDTSPGIKRVVVGMPLQEAQSICKDAVLIEADAEGREIECAVLEDSAGAPLLASPLAEIRPKEGWYDYEAKYTEGKTDILIPAPLPEDVAERIRAQAGAAFSALGCSGLARVDFFFREESGEIFVSELNTLPGFTPMSAYPMMIEATGIPYPTMLDRLIACALSRHKRNEARNFRRLG